MSTRRWFSVGALALALTGAPLFSCSSDTRTAPGADQQPRAALQRDRHFTNGGGADSGSTLDINPALGDFVLYAERSVKLGKANLVLGGDIGVAAMATQSFGPQLIVGEFTFVDPQHDLLAPSVQLDRGAFVGDVEASSVTNDGATL